MISPRLPWLRFFLAFSSVVRQMPGLFSQRRGTVRTLQSLFCQVSVCTVVTRFAVLWVFYITLRIFYIILCTFILFYVLFYIILCNFWVYMCTNHCHRVFTQLQFTNMSLSVYINIYQERQTCAAYFTFLWPCCIVTCDRAASWHISLQ
jgi:hypothetical protein